MRTTSFQSRVAAFVGIGLTFLLAGCGNGLAKAKQEVQAECFYRMTRLSAGGVSYMLVNKLPGTNVVSADAIALYLKPGTEWTVCPATRAKFADFNLDDGPKCRAHGAAYHLYNSALAAQDHPCRSHALDMLGTSKDPWNDQHSHALIDGLMSVLKVEQGKAKADARATLQRITRQDFGEDAEAWQAWWKTNRETFRFKP